jgi:predicted GNAT family acetyltransferase
MVGEVDRREMAYAMQSAVQKPSSQGQGMGSALVEYGNHLADEAGMPISPQASPYGYPVYEKHSFETVQYLDMDLGVGAGCGE